MRLQTGSVNMSLFLMILLREMMVGGNGKQLKSSMVLWYSINSKDVGRNGEQVVWHCGILLTVRLNRAQTLQLLDWVSAIILCQTIRSNARFVCFVL